MDDKCQIEPIRKCLYLMSKHPFIEGMVDSLLNLLFRELGMYSGMLFPISQHSLSLQYGGGVNMTAKADFAIIDALSICRMVVAKDRNVRGSIVNSFPQLIAEAIAAIQNNLEIEISCKRKWEQLEFYSPAAMWGLRVSYHYFFFYNIPVSASILSSMKNKCSAGESTNITYAYTSIDGLNILDSVHREIIITILDAWRADIEKKAMESARRLSLP